MLKEDRIVKVLLASLTCCVFFSNGVGDKVTVDKRAAVVYHDRNNDNSTTGKHDFSLNQFFQEPKLGTTWYNPDGPTPTFAQEQKNGTTYTARLGSDILLSCIVSKRQEAWLNCWHFSLKGLI